MSPLKRWPSRPRRETIIDAALAALLFGLMVGTMRLLTPSAGALGLTGATWQAYAAGAVMTLPLAARRHVPLTVLVVVTGGLVVFRLAEAPDGTMSSVALFLAFCNAGAYGRPGARDVVRAGVTVTLMGFLAWTLLVGHGMPEGAVDVGGLQLASIALSLFYVVAAWVLGDQWRIRREREQQLAARTAELERERDRSAERAAVEERLRIARELHDVLGHHVSVMGVQAAAARRVLARDPDRAGQAMAAIEDSSRNAVIELQRVLSLLRDRDDDRRPTPLLELVRLDEVADDLRVAGLRVTLQVGELPRLPASVELAAARIVQEALTNALRHAGPGTSAWVRVVARDGVMEVVVEDDGRGARPARAGHAGDGHGLTGMRERVTIHGGRFTAGPVPSGGFRVAAVLPIGGGAVGSGKVSAALSGQGAADLSGGPVREAAP